MTSRNKARARAQAAAPVTPQAPVAPPVGADLVHPGGVVSSVAADSDHTPHITHALDARLTR